MLQKKVHNMKLPDHYQNCRILAIDDEAEVRNAYQQALTFDSSTLENRINNVFQSAPTPQERPSRSFPITLAQQGDEALTLVQQALQEGAPYSVAFIDMRMPPGIDGLETARALRQLDDRIYIVFVTAYSDHTADELDEVMEHEILLLRKPFINEEIYQLARSLSRSWLKDRKLEQAIEAAEQASRAKDQFLAAMSHEFRTPLSTLIGFSDLLKESPLNQEQQEWNKKIEQAGNGLLYRINDVLDASKLGSGRLELTPTTFSLHTLLEELTQLHRASLNPETQTLEYRNQLEITASRFGDRERLLQILSNLLGNAIKFTPQGSIQLSVEPCSEQEICFTIQDSGIGMSQQVLESAFHPFAQGDQRLSRNYSGIGMGLHISLQLAEAMGGTLEATSQEGKGSCFALKLPLPIEKETLQPQTKHIQNYALKGNVLLVEDTPEMQQLIHRILENYGLHVEIANNGKEALEQALVNSYSLILMDLQMPVMGGIEATSLLRQLGITTPILALTANLTDAHRKQFMASGGDDFLTKPIDKDRLRASLEKYLPIQPDLPSSGVEESLIDDALMNLFVERAHHLQHQLREGLIHQSWEEIARAAHTIKGSGTTFGYPSITRLGQEICDQLADNNNHAVPALVEQLIREIDKITPTQQE